MKKIRTARSVIKSTAITERETNTPSDTDDGHENIQKRS